jgi:hypothetical protein
LYADVDIRVNIAMKWVLSALLVLQGMVSGCGPGEVARPSKDFPVIAKAKSGDTIVYLSEVKRVGTRIYLVFYYREAEKALSRTSIACSEITGGFDTEFDETVKDGWVKLQCRTNYPIDVKKLEFVLAMCQERGCEEMDITVTAGVPAVGEISEPGVSSKKGDVRFSIERIANLKGGSSPVLDGKPSSRDYVIDYGDKFITVTPGEENVLAVVCKAEFPGTIPDVPQGFSEWDQVLVTTGRGERLGGAKSTGDSGNTRYYALVSIGREEMPSKVKACFFSANTLVSLRKEFAFAGLPNPRE